MNKQNTGADRVMTGFSRNWLEYNTKHLWEEDSRGFKRNVQFAADQVFRGDAQASGGSFDKAPLFHNAGLNPEVEGAIYWNTPAYRIAEAIITDALNTASLPPLPGAGHPKSNYYKKRREADISNAVEWIFSDDEADDEVCLHTFNNCCEYLNLDAGKIRKRFDELGRNLKISTHKNYGE